MRGLRNIKEKLNREENTASELLKLHVDEQENQEDVIVTGSYLRMYNKVQERINTLRWVLGLMDD